MTQYLPPNLLQLFAARDPIPYLAPVDKLPHEKKTRGYLGVGNFLDNFEDPKDTPPCTRVETRAERLERRRREKAEQVAYKLEREIATWDPQNIGNATEDPFKTLFVSRINYDTSESKLRREFEIYGPIKSITMISDKNGKPRGYAFIEYEHERDMHSAYKHADGKKIDGKRVLVDVERARTVKGWLPRRLGGGLGGTRRGGADVNIKHSGREDNERERERYRLEREREDSRSMDHRPEREHRGGAIQPERRRYEDRRRSRSRDRREVRERSRERHRSRSRERRKRRGSRDYDDGNEKRERKESKKKKRSKSRERSEKKRERRDRDKDRSDKERKPDFRDDIVKVKEEPVDDYPQFNMPMNYPLKNEDEEEVKYRPPPNAQYQQTNGQNNATQQNQDWWR